MANENLINIPGYSDFDADADLKVDLSAGGLNIDLSGLSGVLKVSGGEASANAAHSDLGGIGANDHHAQLHASSHNNAGGDVLNHDNLAGFVSNEHIDHSGVSISGGGILSGGGTIASSRTISLAHGDVDHNQTANVHQDVTITADPTFNTITALNTNIALSSMILTGGEISEGTNAGTIKVAALTAMLRTGSGATDTLVRITLAEQDNIAIGIADTYYNVRLTYGTPNCSIACSTSSGNGANIIGIGHALVEAGGTRHYADAGLRLSDGIRKLHNRAAKLRRIEISSGALVSDPGTRHLYVTAAIFRRGINRYETAAKDTFSSGPDTFDYYYWNPNGSVWVQDDNSGNHYTQIDNANYNEVDGGTGKAALGDNKWTTNWVFMHPDDEHILVLYGQSHNKKSNAENEDIPANLPDILDKIGVLLCKIVLQEGNDTLIFENVKYFTFTPNVTVDHNELQGLQGGTVDEYYHLTSAKHTKLIDLATTSATGAEFTELTDGSQTALHSHAGAGANFVDLGDVAEAGIDSADIGKIVKVGDSLSLEFAEEKVEASLSFVIDGGGSTITTGIKGDLKVPFDCTIQSVALLADQTGSIKIDIWKDTYDSFPPLDGDTITGGNEPAISSGTKDQDTTLTSWTTSLTKGDILRFNVDTVTDIQRVTLGLEVDRT